MTAGSIPHVAVLVKHAPRRVSIDPLSGAVTADPRDAGMSSADAAALELALTLGASVTVITAGPDEAVETLREAFSVGATSLVHIPAPADAASALVAEALAGACHGTDLVVCGDYSSDRGSGSVPAFVAAHLGIAQALGVVAVAAQESTGVLMVERRLDRGRRERLRLAGRAVVSVEGSVARLRRASLQGVLEAKTAVVDVRSPRAGLFAAARGEPIASETKPHRPRVQLRPTPDPAADPILRVRQVTDATSSRNPPRTVTAEPAEAAAIIVDSLQEWGYLQ